MATRIIWDDNEIDLLVDERRKRNVEYHVRYRGNKMGFWRRVAQQINRRFGTAYSTHQCKLKWKNLVRDYNVSK
jgi:hypothetical protein